MRQGCGRALSWTALALIGVLLGLAGCTGSTPPAAQSPTSGVLVSYAAAAGQLAGSDSGDAQDQVLDWASTALAAHLGMTAAQYRNAFYDTLPVRDQAFTDLVRLPSGPGREMYDGRGVLHLLVPQGDPHESRTVGLLLDQYRTDSGTDAPQVEIHHYRIDTATRTVTIFDGDVTATADVRASDGYVTAKVNGVAALIDFLSHTSYLSRLELRNGSQLWAEGWNWPAAPDARVDAADLSVLERGYSDLSGPTPGFSLDPKKATTEADLVAVVPGLDRGLARRIIDDDWSGSPFASATALDTVVKQQLYDGNVPAATLAKDGLPNDRTQLWALQAQLTGGSAYSQARYDGGIAGTAVGMTLFYTDYVAKNWSVGTGNGIPIKAVDGFLPNDKVATPWSLCTRDSSTRTGRLWFGENDSAVRVTSDGISIGAQATRLFARSFSSSGEVQPSYDVGRGLSWWDEHYLQISDYEPQYERLDQLMRWSEALDWLATKAGGLFPRLPDSRIPSNLHFADWYAKHSELRERSPIHFVHPPSATQEALSHLPTAPYQNCGGREIQGGVSLGDLIERHRGHPGATLPASIGRGGQFDRASTFTDATGDGRIIVDIDDANGRETGRLTHTITSRDNAFSVLTTGPGEPVDTFGGVRILQADSAPRTVRLSTTIHNGQIAEQVSLQGQDVGTLTTTAMARVVSVQWRPGLMARARTVLESLQRRLGANPYAGPGAPRPTGADGVLATYTTRGATYYDVGGGPADPWLAAAGRNDNTPPPGSTTTFQIGEPDEPDGGARMDVFGLVPHPPVPGSTFAMLVPVADHTVAIRPTHAPDPNATAIQVTTSDGETTKVYAQDGRLVAPAGDPIFGVAGQDYGVAMAARLPKIERARAAAGKVGDNSMAAVLLGDAGVALVGPDTVYLAPSSDVLFERVTLAEQDSPNQTVWFRLVGGVPELVGHPVLGPPAATDIVDLGTVRQTPGAVIYMDEVYRNSLSVSATPLVTSSLPDSTKVTVRTYALPGSAAIDPNDPPDVFSSGGADWWRMDGDDGEPNEFFLGFANPPQSTSATPTSTVTTISQSPAGEMQLLLVCPADTTVAGCPS